MTAFKGWVSRGYLPHFDTPEVIQSVTFRLADSLPAGILDTEVDSVLDAGHGRCLLRHTEIADLVERALLHFDADRYRLLAWVVMPNHVHVLVQPGVPLAELLHTWSPFPARPSTVCWASGEQSGSRIITTVSSVTSPIWRRPPPMWKTIR